MFYSQKHIMEMKMMMLRHTKEWVKISKTSNQGIKAGARKILVPKLCRTRWSSRVETLSALMAKYPAVLETLKIIAAGSNGEPRSKAQSYIRLLEDP